MQGGLLLAGQAHPCMLALSFFITCLSPADHPGFRPDHPDHPSCRLYWAEVSAGIVAVAVVVFVVAVAVFAVRLIQVS